MRCCVKHTEGAVELWTIQHFADFARFLRCPCEPETGVWFLWGAVNECVDEVKYLFKSCCSHGSWACSLFPFCPWEGHEIHLPPVQPCLWDCISLGQRLSIPLLCSGQIFGSTAAPGCPPGPYLHISNIPMNPGPKNVVLNNLLLPEQVLPELPPQICSDAINPHLQRHWDSSSFCCWHLTPSFSSPW